MSTFGILDVPTRECILQPSPGHHLQAIGPGIYVTVAANLVAPLPTLIWKISIPWRTKADSILPQEVIE
jgi:hypothetical protein